MYGTSVDEIKILLYENYQYAVNMDVDVVSSCQVLRELTSLVCWPASSE